MGVNLTTLDNGRVVYTLKRGGRRQYSYRTDNNNVDPQVGEAQNYTYEETKKGKLYKYRSDMNADAGGKVTWDRNDYPFDPNAFFSQVSDRSYWNSRVRQDDYIEQLARTGSYVSFSTDGNGVAHTITKTHGIVIDTNTMCVGGTNAAIHGVWGAVGNVQVFRAKNGQMMRLNENLAGAGHQITTKSFMYNEAYTGGMSKHNKYYHVPYWGQAGFPASHTGTAVPTFDDKVSSYHPRFSIGGSRAVSTYETG